MPYKGGAQAGQDVAGGKAQMMFSASLEAKPLLASGKTRAIAISSQQRSPAFPDIPTVVELTELKDFEVVFWQGMVVPAGTPQPIVDKLQKAIAKVAADPDVIERFKQQGVEIRSSTPAEFKDLLRQGREALDDAHQGAGHQGRVKPSPPPRRLKKRGSRGERRGLTATAARALFEKLSVMDA